MRAMSELLRFCCCRRQRGNEERRTVETVSPCEEVAGELVAEPEALPVEAPTLFQEEAAVHSGACSTPRSPSEALAQPRLEDVDIGDFFVVRDAACHYGHVVLITGPPLLSYTLAGERRIIVPTLEYKEGESGQTEELLIIAERPLREVGILQAGQDPRTYVDDGDDPPPRPLELWLAPKSLRRASQHDEAYEAIQAKRGSWSRETVTCAICCPQEVDSTELHQGDTASDAQIGCCHQGAAASDAAMCTCCCCCQQEVAPTDVESPSANAWRTLSSSWKNDPMCSTLVIEYWQRAARALPHALSSCPILRLRCDRAAPFKTVVAASRSGFTRLDGSSDVGAACCCSI